MEIKKSISIALTTCNGEAYLVEQLESFIRQTYSPYEVIICDDASDDRTVDIIMSYVAKLPIKLYQNKERIGVVNNFRQAISKCTGSWVACCDQDDVWLPDKLSLSANAMEKIDGELPAAVYTDLTLTNATLEVIETSYWTMRNINPAKETFYSILFGNIITGCTLLINRAMAIEVKKMPDKAIMHDFWIACIAYSWGRYAYINQPTVLYRQHYNNVTKNDKVNLLTRVARLYKYIKSGFDNYLSEEIGQANLFYKIYADKLSMEDKSAILNFLTLTDLKAWRRKVLSYYLKR
jgi:glycosyltransferase involved in cell wall biosynthesis